MAGQGGMQMPGFNPMMGVGAMGQPMFPGGVAPQQFGPGGMQFYPQAMATPPMMGGIPPGGIPPGYPMQVRWLHYVYGE
jgi:hypothetical protein